MNYDLLDKARMGTIQIYFRIEHGSTQLSRYSTPDGFFDVCLFAWAARFRGGSDRVPHGERGRQPNRNHNSHAHIGTDEHLSAPARPLPERIAETAGYTPHLHPGTLPVSAG